MVALFGSTVAQASVRARTVTDKEKVSFDFKLNDALGSNPADWQKAFEEAAEKEGYEIVEEDTADSTKVTVIIGKDDADDDNDGKPDAQDKDDNGDGIDDSTQSIDTVDLDPAIPELRSEGTDKNKQEGVYIAVVGENGKETLFTSDVDDFNFSDGDKDASGKIFNSGAAQFVNASYSPAVTVPNRAVTAFPVLLALRIGFQVAKIGYQIYKIKKGK